MCFCRMKSILFTPQSIGDVLIKNRFIRSATWENLCSSDGSPKPSLFSMMKELADGDVGLIIPGSVFPARDAACRKFQLAMTEREHAVVWKDTIEYLHKKGSRLFFQICDGRRNELSNAEIEDVIEQFGRCAKLCELSGCDGIQLHAAHGYLLSRFLSPATNKRTDKWGGSEENRLRLVKEVITNIRKQTNLPITMKINGHDCVDGGITPDLAGRIVHQLPEVAMFEISCGMSETSAFAKTEAYTAEYAKAIRKMNPKAVLASVGGNRNFPNMEKLILQRVVDFIGMSRPFVRQPMILRDYEDNLTMKSSCVSCNDCLSESEVEGQRVFCRFPLSQ